MSDVSEGLRRFLQERLTSLEQIEVVLLLRGDSTRSWTAPEVANELRIAPETAAMRLFLLASSGVLAFEPSGVPRYRYTGSDAATDALIAELAQAYAADRNAILAVVDSGTRDPIRSFADAFKLKK
ncbi:MAG TPA: hypothetical protein VEK79_11155 [Thermoanaerobaculia bacterium]|nr:hypothetical protein [Thermoanaerobaculia bacterium]